ncbi:MAG: TonB-dependent receptor [Bacteroidetes bacterium]|nr:TonB-dependent receptor [Bacteroidota bacterium]
MSRVLVFLTFLSFVSPAVAGTNGILEGVVRDKKTNEKLPGVIVLVVGTQQGTSSDVEGYFQVQNIRAGTYDIRLSHVGHQTLIVKNVVINPDLRTKLNPQLDAADVQMNEIIVIQERPPIQRDVTGTTFSFSSEDVTLLPVTKVADVVTYKAGVTAEGNIRGGKTTEVVYLVDGLPVQDALSGGLKTELPNSSISGLSLYTGGFEPEYGNALSGVVNIVTKTGTEDHRFLVKGSKDNLFGGKQSSKTNEIEIAASGPVLEEQLYYFVSGSGVLSDTRWWQDMQYFFKTPVEKSFSGFGKLDYIVSPSMRFGVQLLYADRDWRDYEFNWRYNLAGLPPQHRTSYRLAAILSQTLSDNFFYTASLSRFSLKSQIGEGSKESLPADDPYQYDFYLQYIVSGQRAWWSRTEQENYTAKFDATYKVSSAHLLKVGAEMNFYDVNSDIVKYEPRKTFFGKPLVNEPQLNFSSSYNYKPRTGAVYIQDKYDVPESGILLNFGVRYDFLDPTASRPAIEAIPSSDTAFTFAIKQDVPARLKQQFSPRIGAATQLAENGYLFLNIGWYFQYPLFDYLYSGLDRVSIARGLSAVTGNPDLEPERTKSYEISVKYSFDYNIVGSITYFKKETTNLIDTKTFVPGDSKLAGTYGFAEYVNTPFADASGFEIIISRDRGDWLTGEMSYTFMTAEGVSGSADDGFYIAQFGLPPATRVYPLSWDQRHTVKATASLALPWDFTFNLFAQYHSGRPYTNYPTATGFEPVSQKAFSQNNSRMPRYFNLDLRATQKLKFDWWPNSLISLYLDVRNVFNENNVKWIDSNGRIGGELSDPGGYYIGRRTTLGMQVEF